MADSDENQSILDTNGTENIFTGYWFSKYFNHYSMPYDEKAILFDYIFKINQRVENFHAVEVALSWPINVLGLIGNFLSLLVMCLHKQMRTPSYVYLRVLSAADFVYCLNFLIEAIINYTLRLEVHKYQHRLL